MFNGLLCVWNDWNWLKAVLVTGKLHKPLCFTDVQKLPIEYAVNKKALMTVYFSVVCKWNNLRRKNWKILVYMSFQACKAVWLRSSSFWDIVPSSQNVGQKEKKMCDGAHYPKKGTLLIQYSPLVAQCLIFRCKKFSEIIHSVFLPVLFVCFCLSDVIEVPCLQ